MSAPSGTLCILNIIKKHYFDERNNDLLSVCDIISNCNLTSSEIETVLVFLKGNLCIGNFEIDQMHNINLNLGSYFLTFRESFIKKLTCSYEPSTGNLYLLNKTINFGEPGKNMQADLLRVIFTDLAKEWCNDEIFQELGYNSRDIKQAIKAKRIYFAARKVTERIAMELKIRSFLTYNTRSVKVNSPII